jgi:putative ABC transport system permease protein
MGAFIRHLGLDIEPTPEIFVPYYQYLLPWMTVVIRSQSDPRPLVPAIRAQTFDLDKNLPLYDISTMEQRLDDSVVFRRHSMWLLGIFAALALILALVGVYGMMAYSVSQRTEEIGVRMTLGASQEDVLRLVLRQGLVLTLTGVGCGLTGSLVLTRFLSSMLYAVRPNDPLTVFGVSAILTTTALLACYIPAHRATKVDPMVALRHE